MAVAQAVNISQHINSFHTYCFQTSEKLFEKYLVRNNSSPLIFFSSQNLWGGGGWVGLGLVHWSVFTKSYMILVGRSCAYVPGRDYLETAE